MEKESLKKKTVNGVIWSAIDRFSTQGIQFVFSILIARLLMPSDYGVIAMLGIFLAVSNTFIDSGFGTALVQKANRTETDFSTVFYFNIVVAIIFYALLWLASPYIASFYNIPMLKDVTRVVALTLVFSALGGIQNAKLSIAINFKTRAIISLISALSTGFMGLYLAYRGYGAWALVFQMVFSSLLNTILLWCFVRWMPSLVFSWQSFRQLFSFGSKLLASALLDTIYNNVYTLVIGKVYSSSSLGLYSRASGLAQYPSSNITGVLQSVTFPVLCSIQNDEERLADAYKRFIRMSAFVVFPLMIGLASVAEPFIRVVLTDKWEGAIYLLQIVCFSMMWYPIHAINLNILQVKGRSDYFLKLEIIKKIQGVCILCITVPISIVAMCYGSIASSLLSLVWNTYYTKRLIGYGFLSQIKDLLPIIIHSLLMGGIVLLVTHFIEVMWIKLFAGILAGGIYYILGAYIMHFDELKEVLAIIKRK
ncbi:lipopolysaccharide biosynthesis protein [Bacteroides sp. OF04-15BH]|uniref:lipopolysaccharide biosynthesis protein n=1 Tax=Bacteroides sp. OF04-15BH TaxID=2292281 RepID=UPI000E5500F3|nr:lipopolysaccharide biosynthesis protein [Bacteroides sp. OF04-15BH]RHP66410.1 lipopolysaccharide biosynthesis protein [Bacteroides sp. OF04-15BH]